MVHAKSIKKSIFEGQVTQQPSAIGSVQAVSFSALACNKFKIFMHLLILKGLKTCTPCYTIVNQTQGLSRCEFLELLLRSPVPSAHPSARNRP